MERRIETVAVLGGGTMGGGIAAACAGIGCRVLLLDVTRELAEKAIERMLAGRSPALEDPAKADLITLGSFENDLPAIAGSDWICEAVVEDLKTKRDLFERLEPLRRDGSVVSTNTSGIPLSDIARDMPQRLRRDIAVTHFFNPVKVMRLMELVPGDDTSEDTLAALVAFCGGRLSKGVVHAKDTVNFIGNRIGCFWMLAGLHKARRARQAGLSVETVDALMSGPVGLPATGLYGLIDLIGLDVLNLVGRNLDLNLPEGDLGRAYTSIPEDERAMVERGQLGRKSGGGFYRVRKLDDGDKLKEVFEPATGEWRVAQETALAPAHGELAGLLFADDAEGRLAWELIGETLCYAASLVPEIADDVVNIDRAMRWGFNWARGPFEMLDALGPKRVAARLDAEGRPIPAMLKVLLDSGAEGFYGAGGTTYLGLDGAPHPVPAE